MHRFPADNDTVMVYRSEDGWRWHRKASNGQIVSESGEAYVDKDHAYYMAESRNVGIAITLEETPDDQA